MVVLGYLDYDRFSRTYLPTMRIASLGSWVHPPCLAKTDFSLIAGLDAGVG